jgi:PiT family inorganic phosphate transporter
VEHILGPLTGGTLVLLVLALLLAFGFEFVNGFHDTANAVATVIYTHTLPPWVAVVMSGSLNLLGVLLSSGAVAFGIIALLPVELVLNVGSHAGFAMVFALLVAAITWNLGTWYLGLPASSSHTLIGSIVGVGLANSVLSKGSQFGDGVNWGKVQDTFAALLISPVVGFICAGGLLLLLKLLIKRPELYQAPDGPKPPPPWIRALLIFTCGGVSFAHGSNDGQKGMGLIMLILIGIVPSIYALNLDLSPDAMKTIEQQSAAVQTSLNSFAGSAARPAPDAASAELSQFIKANGKKTDATFPALAVVNGEVTHDLGTVPSMAQVPEDQRGAVRSNIYLVGETIGKLDKKKLWPAGSEAAVTGLKGYKSSLESITKFIPTWVKVGVALALGFGTMIGWKRIVVTVGEKIGKSHLTYGQGACAELVTMATIFAADRFGLPVSTTHILSSGVAGTMAANHSGLQKETLRNILLAWVLTLPVCVLLGSMLFAFGLRMLDVFVPGSK